jgi:hypothetical protein
MITITKNAAAEPKLIAYQGRVKMNSQIEPGIYRDWFIDDEAARAGFREIMEEQGYEVVSITIDPASKITVVEVK